MTDLSEEVIETPEYTHPEQVNLLDTFDDDEIQEIAATALMNYKSDEDSRSEWLSMHADWLRLYFQKDRPINPPWEGASDESMPILAEACNQFHARAFQAMFPSRNIIQAIQVGKPDEQSKERAKRVGTHMSWQLMVKDRKYESNKDSLLLALPLHGSFFTKTYNCPVRKRNITENVRAVDFVVPYGTGPRDLEDIERKTQIIYLPINKAKKLVRDGFFSEEPEVYDSSEVNEVDQTHDDVMGVQSTGSEKKKVEDGQYEDGTYAKIIEQHGYHDLDGDGIPEPYIVWVDIQSEKALRVAIRYDTDENGDPTKDKEPVEYFTHYPFLPNPDGFYGLGFGHLLGQLNTAINKLIRQTVDAGTLANIGNMSGFVDKRLSVKKGEVRLQLGKFIPSESSMEDISRGIYQFKFPGPNASLMQIAELLMSRSDRLATVTEALTGQTEKVMQPTTILALIEQSLQVFSTVYKRVLKSWEDELMKHFRLNRKFMDPEEYFGVLDITGEMKESAASREDYEDDLQVLPVADPKMSSERQKLAKAEAVRNWGMSSPLVVNSPQHLYAVERRYLEAIGEENIDELLPKPQSAMIRVDDPYKENVGALSPIPMMPPAYPDQDHGMHIKAHGELLNDQIYGPRLSEAGMAELQDHINAHAALMYGQTEGLDGMEQLEADSRDGGIPPAVTNALQPTGGLENGPIGEGEAAPGPGGGNGLGGGVP